MSCKRMWEGGKEEAVKNSETDEKGVITSLNMNV